MERDSGGGQGRISRGNGRNREMFQRIVNNNGQDGGWLLPTQVEERYDARQESQMPPDPLPSRFSDWSSLGSPHTRTILHSAPDREEEQNGNIPNQLNVESGTVPRHEIIRTNSPEEVIVPPPSSQQVEEQNVQVIEVEPSLLNIEVRMQRDDMGTDRGNNIPIN